MIHYRAGYKYQLARTYRAWTGIRPEALVVTDWIALEMDCWITIREGYAWDGPSGPAIDTKNFMRGSLVHDAIYQLIRDGHIGQHCRDQADRLLQTMCREDGMSAMRAWWVYQGVAWGGGPSALAENNNPILTAP